MKIISILLIEYFGIKYNHSNFYINYIVFESQMIDFFDVYQEKVSMMII